MYNAAILQPRLAGMGGGLKAAAGWVSAGLQHGLDSRDAGIDLWPEGGATHHGCHVQMQQHSGQCDLLRPGPMWITHVLMAAIGTFWVQSWTHRMGDGTGRVTDQVAG